MENYRIRNMTKEEYNKWIQVSIESVIDMYIYLFDSTYNKEEKKVKKMFQQLLPKGYQTSNHYFYVMDVENHNNVGFVWYGEHSELPSNAVLLCDIIIHPEHRSKGLGRILLRDSHNLMFNKGYDTIFLHVEARNYAKNLYTSLGYEEYQSNNKSIYMKLSKEKHNSQ